LYASAVKQVGGGQRMEDEGAEASIRMEIEAIEFSAVAYYRIR